MVEKYIEYIQSQLDERTLLEQLAEETAELNKAALKLIRAKKLSNNYTPVEADEATDNFFEELGDLRACLMVLGYYQKDGDVLACLNKIERWAKRLGYKEDKPTRCIDPVMKMCQECEYGCVHYSYDWDDDYFETSCMYDLEDTKPTEDEIKEFNEWANRSDKK